MAINHVFKTNTFTVPADDATNITDTGPVTVEQDAFIVGTGDNGLEFYSGPNKIKVDGYIESNLNGMALYDVTTPIGNASLTVGTEGTIVSSGTGGVYAGISSAQALDVTNSGLIQGDKTGISYAGINHSLSKTVTITNNAGGEIHGDEYGIYLNDSK